MINLLGYFINEKKLLVVELNQIYGIGFLKSKQLYNDLGFSKGIRVSDLNEQDLEDILIWIKKNIGLTGSNLERYNQTNIKHLIEKKAYRGFRHLRKLPVNGQRRRTNRKTQRKLGQFRNQSSI